jgi:VanZ family protein
VSGRVEQYDRPATRAPLTSFVWLWLPAIVYMAGIFSASAMSDPPMPSDVPDVSLHGLAYFGLAALLIRAFAGGTWRGVTGRAVFLGFAIAVVYGVSDEWHQMFVPGRHADIRDLRADAIGAAAAAAGVWAWGIIRRL